MFGHLKSQVVVIGSGPGGAVTACILAQHGLDVLLLEEGPYIELEDCPPFSQSEMVRKYRNGGINIAIGKPRISYVEGRCVGGGSEINGALWHRTPDSVLDEWTTQYKLQAASPADMRRHFQFFEDEMSVSLMKEEAPPASRKLEEGASKLGWKSLEVPRLFQYDGSGHGHKLTMTKSFLPRALDAGCKLLPDTKVTRLRRADGKWQITALSTADATLRELNISAETVFLSCGAIQTPLLLRRNGISNNIGNSLHLHPAVKVLAEFEQAVNKDQMGIPVHQVNQFAPKFRFGCSVSTVPYMAVSLVDHLQALPTLANRWQHMAIYYAMTRGGQGTVRPLPYFKDPLVQYRLGLNELEDLAEALKRLCECLLASGAVALYPSITGGAVIRSEKDLSKLPAALTAPTANLMTVHLFSSCPMGELKGKTALDSFGKVNGFDNLYVSDGSMLCGPPGINPQGTIMSFAHRNALAFLGKL